MRAARSEPAESVPVWIMRQAGRFLPEYRAIREQVPFLKLCKTPDLTARIMLSAVERLNVNAAIIFSDILLLLEPLGLDLEFLPNDGPKINNPITKPDDVHRLRELESAEELPFVLDTVRYTREGLHPNLPLIGFTGAPFTLAAYAVEGGASKNFARVKAFMHTFPKEWQVLMKTLAISTARYLNGQIQAGCQIVQIFDSWVGCLSTEDYVTFVLPFSKMLIDLVLPGTPIIHFGPGNPMLLPHLRAAGGHVLGVDWRVSISQAWEMIGSGCAVQGNLDPTILLTNRDIIRQQVQSVLRQVERRPGFIFNLGHGILPQTPVENAIAFVEAVHEFGRHA